MTTYNERFQAVLAQLNELDDGSDESVHLHRVTCDAALPMPAVGPEADAPVWVQVASGGVYKGYAGGAFEFNASIFAQIVRNFRKHPSYRDGAADVIPWDFNHASAAFAGDGSIPLTGTPAQGWVRELDVRAGADGRAQLWAFTRWLEPARSYVKEGRYKWASVVVGFDVRDQISGANIGAVLESIALTNNPFIEGMQPLAASRHGVPSQHQGTKNMTKQLVLTPARGGRPATLRLATAATSNDIAEHGLPPWLGPENHSLMGELVKRARAANAFREVRGAAQWLLAQPEAAQLQIANDSYRLSVLSALLIRQMNAGSRTPGSTPATWPAAVETKLSNTPVIDARMANGRNPVEKAVLAMRQADPLFASQSFEAQIQLAANALRTRAVVA